MSETEKLKEALKNVFMANNAVYHNKCLSGTPTNFKKATKRLPKASNILLNETVGNGRISLGELKFLFWQQINKLKKLRAA